MTRRLLRSLAVAVPLSAAAMAGVAPAAAHEGRVTGAFRLVVGWGDEPAYTGFRNSVQVTITEANGGAPVTDVGESLKVEVIKGDDKLTLPFVRIPPAGDYRAWLTPTRPGSYTFRVNGTIRGQNVNESFSSSSSTFNEVEDVAAIQFPAKDPTTGQLTTRIDREVPRLEATVEEVQDQAEAARTLALAGVAVGALGVLAAAGGLVAARRGTGGGGDSGSRAQNRMADEDHPESLSR